MKHNFTPIKIFFISFANKHLQYLEFPQYLKGLQSFKYSQGSNLSQAYIFSDFYSI